MSTADDFDEVRNDPDPIRRGRRAAELMTVYQQRATELARLRKAAIEEAHHRGLSYTEIADQLGITKGRISQIRATAPQPERAFFGVGPVNVGIPRRFGLEEGRERPFFDANDQATQQAVESTLSRLSLAYNSFAIDPDRSVPPAGDCVIICGPKSAPIARQLLEHDPILGFERDEEAWWITDTRTGQRHRSPYRRDSSNRTDIGYFARHRDTDRILVHIAGITSIGSLGVAHWLDGHLNAVFDPAAELVNGVVECDFDADFSVTDSRLIVGPYIEVL
ncbi:sigma factor-like helix-turn-helix DNA-binding protein [Nocardia sp. alder85J]|uniref:sigma factor-like helix-turn-helix DNA-binding protein n=1 Tax=Nocardia sp. alder85J TaxID=2862949 RepID=UPI001CD49C81|nr:sigma factor-like helix-turn-helix DNA-binding protein [Nocardia sp. alder85J]MCX4095077.1 sigma-70 family RNA polymerase sigma factor [Nocardia sp. alder85J]